MTTKKRTSKPRNKKAHRPSSNPSVRDPAMRKGKVARSAATASVPERPAAVFELPAAWRREPVLSEKALAFAAKMVKSRRLSIKFLMEGGFIERPGKLHRNYR
jgi:hypothetical protein